MLRPTPRSRFHPSDIPRSKNAFLWQKRNRVRSRRSAVRIVRSAGAREINSRFILQNLPAVGPLGVQDCSRMPAHASIKSDLSPRNHYRMLTAFSRYSQPASASKPLRWTRTQTSASSRHRRQRCLNCRASRHHNSGSAFRSLEHRPPGCRSSQRDRAWRSRFHVGNADNRLGPFVVARRVTSPVHSERVTTALPCTVVAPREVATDGLPCGRTEASAFLARRPCLELPPDHRSTTGSALAWPVVDFYCKSALPQTLGPRSRTSARIVSPQ